MRILLFGANGQLGKCLRRVHWPEGTSLIAHDRHETDLCYPDAPAAAIASLSPDLVINAAAYTAVDEAEDEPELAFAINAQAPAAMAAACEQREVPFIHISTDYVFDGTKRAPYLETDPVCPMGAYGSSKAEGEQRVRQACERHVILRTAWVYSAFGNNFVKTMLRLSREREVVRVVADQIGNPTSAHSLADAILAIAPACVATPSWGTYHLAGQGDASWYDLAESVFVDMERRIGRRPKNLAITSLEYPTPTRRPANSRLNCDKIETAFNIRLPPWRRALQLVLDQLYQG